MLTEFICIKHQMHQSILNHQSMSLKERARIPVNSAEWELNACHLVHTVSLCYISVLLSHKINANAYSGVRAIEGPFLYILVYIHVISLVSV